MKRTSTLSGEVSIFVEFAKHKRPAKEPVCVAKRKKKSNSAYPIRLLDVWGFLFVGSLYGKWGVNQRFEVLVEVFLFEGGEG